MANEEKDGLVDKDVQEEIAGRAVEIAVSDEKEMRRVEINYYCEFLSTLKKLNGELDCLNNVITMVSEDKLVEYFAQLTDNFKKEEKRVAAQEIAQKSHQVAKN